MFRCGFILKARSGNATLNVVDNLTVCSARQSGGEKEEKKKKEGGGEEEGKEEEEEAEETVSVWRINPADKQTGPDRTGKKENKRGPRHPEEYYFIYRCCS